MSAYFYPNREALRVGNRVLIARRQFARVEQDFLAGTQDAAAFSCPAEGSFLLACDDGDCQLWTHTNEDIELVHRGKP